MDTRIADRLQKILMAAMSRSLIDAGAAYHFGILGFADIDEIYPTHIE